MSKLQRSIYVQFNISSDDDEDDEDDEDGDDGDGSEDGGEDGEDEDGEDNEVDNIDCSISITKVSNPYIANRRFEYYYPLQNYKSLLLNCSASSQGFEPYRVRFIEDSNLVLHEPTAESEEQIKARDVGPDVRSSSYFSICDRAYCNPKVFRVISTNSSGIQNVPRKVRNQRNSCEFYNIFCRI